MNRQQKSRFSLFPRAFKNRDPKSSKKSSPGGQNEPQELLRRSQEQPKRPQDGPKSRQERPKRRPRAARSAPKGRPRRPRSAKRPLGRPPGPILASFWGALGFIFKQLRRPFRSSRALRQTIENTLRNHWSKGLVLAWPAFGGRKRNHDEGFTFFSGQSEIRDPRSDVRPPVSEIRDPRSGIWDPRSEIRDAERLLCLRIQLASQTCFLIRRNSKTHGFYLVPCFPSLSSPTRGSPRLEITRKCSSKSLVKRSFETAAGQKRIRTMARWPGFGGACPTGDPATEPNRLNLGRRGACW